jgi:hypothetical protein
MNSNRPPAPVLNTIARGVNTAVNSVLRTNTPPTSSTFGNQTLLIAIVSSLVIAVGITLYMFWDSVVAIFEDIYNYFASVMGTSQINIGPSSMPVQPLVQPSTPQVHIQEPPVPAQPVQSSQESTASSILNQVLPERRQVFHVSANRYTYYDAEPLCKALGAELATYEQMKEAYENGADYCSYGWSAGQMALYPTQEATWLKLQKGPEEQRRSCGAKPGLQGGFMDNAELRFGVNCFGKRPLQKPIDQEIQSTGENTPMTPEMIEFDRKVAKYRGMTDTIAIMPFNNERWSQ